MADQENLFVALVAITAVVGLIILFAGTTTGAASYGIGYCTMEIMGFPHVRPVLSAEECMINCVDGAVCTFQASGEIGTFEEKGSLW